jgi:hypothetical protein
VTQRARTAAVFIVGLALGVIAGLLLVTLTADREPRYVATADVLLHPGSESSGALHGPLPARTTFRVTMRKGDVNYLELHSVAYDRDLRGRATSIDPRDIPPWNRNTSAPTSETPVSR